MSRRRLAWTRPSERLLQPFLGRPCALKAAPTGHRWRPRTAELFAVAQRLYAEIGLGTLPGVTVGGGSDGNFATAAGARVLDGLGCTGDGAHADHEHILISSLPERTALVAALLGALLSGA